MHTAALNARTGPTWPQWAVVAATLTALAAAAWLAPGQLGGAARLGFLALFAIVTALRVAAVAWARPTAGTPPSPLAWPDYTLIVPLFREAEMIAPLLQALDRIDYPRDQLQIILALEAEDLETQAAVARAQSPEHVEILIVSPGRPRTKPRACNAALALARGEHIVVYDAEDRPDPGQLKEAASRFACSPPGLACLQAPLRIPLQGSFTMRQFALEYGALFEVILPALARLGAPFPLGGTSNHFRAAALRAVGGWDAWNVTEDADVGFRLTAAGYRLGMLTTPTWEDPPRGAREWVPQRSRWLKGYMQTWGVHMRRPWSGGLAWLLALQLTIGMSIVSAVVNGPTVLIVAGQIMLSTVVWTDQVQWPDLALFFGGWFAAALAMNSGARRAGLSPRLSDALLAPAYWALQSVAFWRAVYQLVRCPHYWDKTPHHAPEPEGVALDAGEPERVTRTA